MAAFTTFFILPEDLAHKVHDLETDVLKVRLTTTAPNVLNDVLADLAGQIDHTNCDTVTLTQVTSQRPSDGATYVLTLADLVITATGGAIPTFRYVSIYNETATSAAGADPLIGFADYGENVDLAENETITLDFATEGNDGVLTIGVCP